ncbi:FIVAR domain-containing protein [Clostridium sp. D33t1_170424_F3]|uniref:FIVAR domain-containing protein n=1 Tax=Clostridium sp. D33t1_170424_F3 TaxID=2787099 RepID=UPI0018AA7B70|nr:FIVAR domain-containing protein [Clostridium sp. D33t1_170424_F3]
MRNWKRGLASLLAGVMLLSSAMTAPVTTGAAKSEGIGRLPTMGWCSWNLYQQNISEAKIKSQADAMVSKGLADKGYEYVIVDDGCLQGGRDAEGNLQPQWNKFPNSFKPVSDYVHGLDLKFGMYNSAGTKTCAGLAGSYNHEARDAQTFADWGIDFLKYDFCYNPLIPMPLEPIPGESNGQSFTTTTISSMDVPAPAIPKFVVKKVKDGVETVLQTVNITSENTTLTGGAVIDNGYNPQCLGMLDANADLSKAGMGTVKFQMDEIDPMAKYAVDVYCVHNDKTRWLSMQVNPDTATYNKFYIQSAATGDWNSANAKARTIYNVPLQQGENRISFYLDKQDIIDAYQQDSIRSYTAMADALDATGRDVVLNICDWGWSKPNEWGKDVGHFWRTTTDITPYAGRVDWSGGGAKGQSVMGVYERNVILDEYAGPYGYNDPDMLTVGLSGLNMEQNKSHFSLWCMMAAPLLLGTDLTTASQQVLDIIGNEKIIALDQDALCLQAKRFKQVGNTDYLVKPLADGSVALCIFNKASTTQDASIAMSEVAAAASAKVTAKGSEHLTAEQKALFTNAFANAGSYASEELWTGEKADVASDANISVNLPAYGVKVFKLSSSAPAVSVNVTPKAAEVEQGGRMQFAAEVLNAGHNDAVTWTVEGATNPGEDATHVCELGWLFVAADEPVGTVLTVKAASDADPSKFDTATVTVVAVPEPPALTLDTGMAEVPAGSSKTFSIMKDAPSAEENTAATMEDLAALLEQAETYKAADFTDSSAAILSAAVSFANSVLNIPGAPAEMIQATYNALATAVNGLVWKDASFAVTAADWSVTDPDGNSVEGASIAADAKDPGKAVVTLGTAVPEGTKLVVKASNINGKDGLTATATILVTVPVITEHDLQIAYGPKIALTVNGVSQELADKAGKYTQNDITAGEEIALTFAPMDDGREFVTATITVNGVEQEAAFKDGDRTVAYYDLTMPNEDTTVTFTSVVVYKAMLRSAIASAEEAMETEAYDNMVPVAKKNFDAAYEAAVKVEADVTALQADVDEATLAMADAMNYLSCGKGDKTKLQLLLKTFEGLNAEDFTEASWEDYAVALSAAHKVYGDENALVKDVDDAAKALTDAFEALVRIADSSRLAELVTEAESYDLNDYTPDSQIGLEDLIKEAKALLAKEDATQEELDGMMSRLTIAIVNLRLKPDKSYLQELIDDDKNINEGEYTEESYAVYKAAYTMALKVLEDPNATEQDVTGATDTLETGRNALVRKGEDKPGTGNTGSTPNKGSSSGGSSSRNNSYGGEGTAVVGAAQAMLGNAAVVSDTTVDFTLKRGSAYCFKMTVINGNSLVPSFTTGNGSVLKTQFVAKIGNDYYYRVYAVGTPGQSAGVYTTLPGQNAVKHCTVAIG